MRCAGRLVFCAIAFAIVGARAGASALAATQTLVPTIGGAPWSTDETAKLAGDLDAQLAQARVLRGAHVGVLAVETATGRVLYARNADDEIQPASTLKLVVGSAALDRLTPAFRFRTTLSLADLNGYSTPTMPPLAIVLQAQGDPTFSSADLAAGVATLPSNLALRSVFVDDTAFDDVPYPDGWTWDDFGQDYAPRISAATLDENVVTLVVSPGARVAEPAIVRYPDGALAVPAADCVGSASGSLSVRNAATTGPRSSDEGLEVAPRLGVCATLAGAIPLGTAPRSLPLAVADPRGWTNAALERALTHRGVALSRLAVAGDAGSMPFSQTRGFLSPRPPFWTHDSAPLTELLGPRFWIPSDNLFGENLLKTLGRATAGSPGTTASGIAFEKTWLQSIGIDPATVTLADGCGMSQYDRITARDLVTILQHDWNGPNRQLVLDSLPIGGVRGTIEGIAGTPAAGRVFAKTGSMMHVRGLAGYLATERHGAVTFAFEVDDWNGDYGALASLRAAVLARILDT